MTTKTILKSSALATACALSLVACIQKDEAPANLSRAIPTADQVKIKLPEGAARTVGQLADWYVATRNVTRTFNGGTGWVLVLIHTIVEYPVTSVSGDTYTWGPWSDALDPAEYKLDVRAVGDGTYEYQLSGRSKVTANAAFEVVIDGKSDPRLGDNLGNGQFLLDFDAAKRVNPIDGANDKGQIDVHYDLAQKHLDLGIMTTDDQGQPLLADYAYNESAAGGGDMTFNFAEDAGGTSAREQVTLRSRWTAGGLGRADARLTGGDLATSAIASECWDGTFRRTFYTDNVNFAPTEGDAASCAFATADLPPAH